ncbi:ABC transporter substrate binding protein [Halarcobacter sp.]|uniref:ABC transporter substrate binding protein n=1 Tax=Halarcobacter sp. TaxID=2321133 RepID=UPI003A8FAD09
MKTLIKIFTVFLLLTSFLNAQDNNYKNLSIDNNIVLFSTSIEDELWSLNYENLKKNIENYLSTTQIEAVIIYDSDLDKYIMGAYEQNDKITFFQNNELPSKFTNQKKYSSKNKSIFYQGKNIGKVFVYYKENKFNNLNLNEEEITWLENHTSIRVHAEEKWEPFNFIEGDQVKGYSNDYIRLIAKKLGLKIEFIKGYTWDEYINLLKDKKIDIISNMVKTKEREEFAIFSEKNIHNISPSIYSNKIDLTFKSVKDLEGYKVALVKGFWFEDIIKENYPKIDLITVENSHNAVNLVSNETVDAIIDLAPVIQNLITKYAINNVYFHGVTNFEDSINYYDKIGIRKDWPIFKSIIDKTINSFTYQEKLKLNRTWLVNKAFNNSNSQINRLTLTEQIFKNSGFRPVIYNKTKKVLILHSYHQGYKWTDDITAGIKSLFPKKSNVALTIEYMDTKRRFDETYLEILKKSYLYRYSKEKFDLIIASDNNAFDFLIENRNLIFGDTPVAFLGVNNFKDSQLKGIKNITGIEEKADFESTLKLIPIIQGDIKNLLVVLDNTKTAQLINKRIEKIKNKYTDINFIDTRNLSIDELLAKVKDLPSDSAILYLSFFRDKNNKYFNTNEVIKSISRISTVPIYGVWAFLLGDGIIGGKLLSGYSQGLEVANLANTILQGKSANDIKVSKESTSTYIFDEILLDKFDIDKTKLPENSIIINEQNNRVESKVTLTKKEQFFLKNHPTIKVSNELDWAPFDFAIGNQPHGYFIDLLQLISKKTGLELEFVNGFTWSELMDKFENKEIDLVHPVGIIEERKQKWIFSEAAFSYKPSYATKKTADEISNISSLENKTIAVGRGYAYEKYLRKNHPNLKLRLVDSTLEGLNLVSKGEVYTFIDPEPVLKYMIKKHFFSDLKVSGWFHEYNNKETSKLHFMSHKNKPELISIINKGLLTLTPGELSILENKWFGSDTTKEEEKIELTREELKFLQNKKVIRMCALPDALPYEAISEEGKHIGIAEDMIQIMESKIGIKILLEPTQTWVQSHEYIKQGRCDILPIVQNLPSRREYLDFTKPYIKQTTVIATRNEEIFVTDLDEVKDKKVAIVKKYAHSNLIKRAYPELNIVGVANIKEGLEKVRSKEVYGYIDALGSISYELQEQGNYEIKIAGKVGFDLELSIGTRKDEPLLNTIFTKAINAVTQKEIKEIYDKWITVRFEDKIDYNLIYKIIAISLLILIPIVFWNRKLKAEISKRKEVEIELINARQKALNASKAKSDFLANMSHEIRTPMNGIIGMTTLAIKNIDIDKDKAKDYIKKSQTSANILLKIINDILDFSKIEAGKLEINYETISLRESVSAINDIFSHMIEEKELEFIIEQDELIPEFILGDKLRLFQILTNLISNAVKFTQKGYIKVKIEFLSKDNDDIKLRFSVIDTGKGIAKKNQEKLFKSFSQEDSSISKEYGGTGLGLAISKKLVELMNGEIGFKSKKNEGSSFFFTISTKIVKNIKEKESLEQENSLEQNILYDANILLVEDNDINQELAQTLLSDFVKNIEIAANGLEAIEKLKEHNSDYYSLILMDIHMPIMDGYTATKKIKADDNYKNLPIIAMTANALTDDINKAFEYGMIDHIAKPIDIKELKAKVTKVLSGKEIIQKEVNEISTKTKEDDLYFDAQSAIDRMLGREDLYKNLLINFRESKENYLSNIKAFKQRDDIENLTSEIHTLKGLSKTLGAEKFGDFLIDCEKEIKEKEKLSDENLEKIVSGLEKVVDECNNWLKSNRV